MLPSIERIASICIIMYNDARYATAASSALGVPGLFPNFDSAVVLLQMARTELQVDLITNGSLVVEEFFVLLDQVQLAFSLQWGTHTSGPRMCQSIRGGKWHGC